jgi:hypothetical protein
MSSLSREASESRLTELNDVLTGSHFSGRLSIEHFSPVRFRRKEDSDVTVSKS